MRNKTVLVSVIAALIMSIRPITSVANDQNAFFAFPRYSDSNGTVTHNLERFNIGGPVTDIGNIKGSLSQYDIDSTVFDSQGQLWVSFQGGSFARVNQQTAEYTITGKTLSGFWAMTFGPDGTLYGVMSSNSHARIYRVVPDNASTTFLLDLDVTAGIIGMVFDKKSNLYFASDWQGNFYKFDLNFQKKEMTHINVAGPGSLTFGPNGDLFQICYVNALYDGLYKIDPYQYTATSMETLIPGDNNSLVYGPIPEPATLLLLAFGGLALRKRNH